MNKGSRYLITTSIRETWQSDQPVIFLNTGCVAYQEQKYSKTDCDAYIARPFGIKQSEKDAAQVLTKKYENILFEKLVVILNEYHGQKFSDNYWRIIIGHWLRRYVDAIYYRYGSLTQTLGENEISGFSAIDSDGRNLIPVDSSHALKLFDNEMWNSEIYGKIISHLNSSKTTVCPVSLPSTMVSWDINRPIKSHLKKALERVFCLFVRSSDGFMMGTYLGFYQEVKLAIFLRQFPQYWSNEQFNCQDLPSITKRHQIKAKYFKPSNDEFLNVLSGLLLSCLPISYLEGYRAYLNKISTLSWPKFPKFIFTSNHFDTNDLFKVWAALHVERGSKYIVGQHGNNYGTSRYDSPTIEELTATKFLTWGWEGSLSQHVKTFMLKPLFSFLKKENKKLLLVEQYKYQKIRTWDTDYEFQVYFLEQQIFVSALSPLVRRELCIKLHSDNNQDKWYAQDRWHDFSPDVFISASDKIEKLLPVSKLVVFSYDSTGVLECLASNIPMIAFWQNNLDHLKDHVKEDYQELIDVGIVHLTPTGAADKINEIWGSVDEWWSNDALQEAIKKFTKKYANIEPGMARKLKEIIEDGL